MPFGPCRLCGATNYPNSLGGPEICPSCDCGRAPTLKPPVADPFPVSAIQGALPPLPARKRKQVGLTSASADWKAIYQPKETSDYHDTRAVAAWGLYEWDDGEVDTIGMVHENGRIVAADTLVGFKGYKK
jgi:hypothetical protein